MLAKLRAFRNSRSGNYGMMFAMMMPAVLGAVGFAVDLGTIGHARSQLQQALDAAVLAASRIGDASASRQDAFDAYLAANVAGFVDLENLQAELEIDRGANYIATKGTARAQVTLYIPYLFGDSRYVSVSSQAYQSTDRLEVVMVLDNTGSMGAARMASLRAAAGSLVDILSVVKTPDREVFAALVPFVTAVNVKGAGFKPGWIDWNAASSLHGANFDPVGGQKVNHIDLFTRLGHEWKGCVEARPGAHARADTPPNPSDPDTLFVPYFAPDEPGSARFSGDSGSSFNNTYLDETTGGTQLQQQRSSVKYSPATYSRINETGPLTTGPNYACPTPIVPLTQDFDTLKAEIAKMIHWNGSGTNVSEGLAWGLRVLSPGEPYTEGKAFDANDVSKHIVVFTDGENNVFGASNETINKSDYGAYSFVDQGRMGTTNRSTALGRVNTWTQELCTTLKQNEVQIHAVMLGADTAANRALYSACASSPENYYPMSDVSELEHVFRRIASNIASLSVTN